MFKKLLSVALIAISATTAFANSTNIAISPKKTTSNPDSAWTIIAPENIITFYSTQSTPANVQVHVDVPTYQFDGWYIPDDATVNCNAKDYTLKAGDSLVCAVTFGSSMTIKDKAFKNGTSGHYSVLE